MTDEPNPPTATAYAVSLKLPDFWPSDPELWFAQVEALFTAQNITQEKTKFGHVVRVLPARYASEVPDIILQPPEQPYKVLKAELTKRVCLQNDNDYSSSFMSKTSVTANHHSSCGIC